MYFFVLVPLCGVVTSSSCSFHFDSRFAEDESADCFASTVFLLSFFLMVPCVNVVL